MSGRYLTDLAQVVRATGLVVQEEPGWQTRARNSGGYASGRPTHIMVHHTASGASSDGQQDVDYCCYVADARPVANLYLSRSGKVWIMAAGCTNTNGSGHDWWGGGVPDDSMNTYAIGIEPGNSGTGEPWPSVQQEAYAILVRALMAAYGIPVTNVRAHYEWTDRKVDPAGESRWATGSAKWAMDRYRSDVAAGWPGGSLPPPTLEDEPVEYLEVYRNATQYSLFVRSGIGVVNITNAEREADKGTRNPDPPTIRVNDATALKALILYGDEPVWYDGSKWPPVSAFGGHVA